MEEEKMVEEKERKEYKINVNMEDKETKNRKKYRDDNNKDGKKASS
jgi:hypothetical protein